MRKGGRMKHRATNIAGRQTTQGKKGHLVNRGLPPSTGVVAETAAGRDGCVQASNLEVGVRWGWPITLHVDEPGRWRTLRHAQRHLQVL